MPLPKTIDDFAKAFALVEAEGLEGYVDGGAGAGVTLGLVLAVHVRILPAWLPADPEWQSLTGEQTKLAKLMAAAPMPTSHGPATPLPALPAGWRIEELTAGPDADRRVRYSHLRPAELRWSDLIAFVTGFEPAGTARITGLEIRSRGTRSKRVMAAVELTVTLPAGTTRRQAGATFPPRAEPAMARTIGPVVPSAFRLPGPDGCAFRPRLPGGLRANRPYPPFWAG
jgi:hypothetical protein